MGMALRCGATPPDVPARDRAGRGTRRPSVRRRPRSTRCDPGHEPSHGQTYALDPTGAAVHDRPMPDAIDLDHVAVAMEHRHDAWPRYRRDLGGLWASGGE